MAKKKKTASVRPEWQNLIDVREIGKKPYEISIEATPAERGALAQRAGVESIDNLKAELTMARDQGDLVLHVSGRVIADVTQKCVITTEPVHTRIEEAFQAWYSDPDQAVAFAKAKREKELEKGPTDFPILEEFEDPEPITEGHIDAGELAAQYLCLAIDPYPHAEGAQYEGPSKAEKTEAAAEPRRNPFAALKDWKARHGSEKS